MKQKWVFELLTHIWDHFQGEFKEWLLQDEDLIFDLVDKIDVNTVHKRIVEPKCNNCDLRNDDLGEPNKDESRD